MQLPEIKREMMRHAWNPKGCTQSKSMSGQNIAFRDVARKNSAVSGPSELTAARRQGEWEFLSDYWQ